MSIFFQRLDLLPDVENQRQIIFATDDYHLGAGSAFGDAAVNFPEEYEDAHVAGGTRFSPWKREWPQNDREYNMPAVGLEIGKFLPENGQGHRDKNADEYK